jgi:hypothetical protein
MTALESAEESLEVALASVVPWLMALSRIISSLATVKVEKSVFIQIWKGESQVGVEEAQNW